MPWHGPGQSVWRTLDDGSGPMESGTLEHYRRLVASGRYVHDVHQERAARHLDQLARNLEPMVRKGLLGRVLGWRRTSTRGAWLYGGVGTGKSMLMDLLFENVRSAKKERHHFHAFMRDVHACIQERQASSVKSDDTIRFAAKALLGDVDLLCLDEFHVTDIADAMILGRLFRQFLDLGTVLVATSNEHPRDLYQGGINRQLFRPFIATLEHELDIIEVDAQRDYRWAFLASTGTYLSSLDNNATARLDDAFRHLAGDADIAPLDIPLQGRVLHVPRQARHVARFTFEELCGRPLAAPDYLALAHAFHTVIIDDIPVMSPAMRNEARRFIILIDILYEERVGLLCSAAAPAEGLYPEGDGARTFRRTASRLMEMQSAEYLESRRAISQPEGKGRRRETLRP